MARTSSGSGPVDTRLTLGSSGTVLWGDWNGQGVETPAIFQDGAWRFYDTLIGPADQLVAASGLTYGAQGDRPVVGDWDGDGRTDIGVVRGRTWFIARPAPGAVTATTWRRFDFGAKGAQPVAGDWAGTGRDGIASYDRGTWSFKLAPSAQAPVRERRLKAGSGARRSDTAVAGDFSGAGRDGFAIVRGDRWRFLGDVISDVLRSSVEVERPSASWTATAWTTAAGSDGDLCPTASWTLPISDESIIAPVALTGAVPTPTDPGAADVRAALLRAERYVLGSNFRQYWAPVRYQNFADVRSFDRRPELAYRGAAMSALTVATALGTDQHDNAVAGLSRASATAYVQYVVGSIACQHLAVTPGGWGDRSQTAHWAGLTAQAAWLVWDDLSLPVRSYVATMVRSEAEDQLTTPVGYWKDRRGALNPGRQGDTAAEESAWNAALLELAHAMFPRSAATRDYRAQAVQLEASAYAAPSDLVSNEVVNGVTLRSRLDGTNALDTGVVVNHHLVHPDYMGNIQMLWWGVDFATLAGGTVSEAAFTGAERVYGAFSTLDFEAGEPSAAGDARVYLAPGGTIYRPGAQDLNAMYFPDGSDYGTSRRAPFVSIDAHAVALGLTPAGGWPADEALEAHAAGHLALGAAYSDGRTYSPDATVAALQDTYPRREEYAASQVASAWLALVLHELDPDGPAIDTSTYAVPEINSRPAPVPRPGDARLGP